jgi:hypothetical protein
MENRSQKTSAIFEKLPKVTKRPMGESSPYFVTLTACNEKKKQRRSIDDPISCFIGQGGRGNLLSTRHRKNTL